MMKRRSIRYNGCIYIMDFMRGGDKVVVEELLLELLNSDIDVGISDGKVDMDLLTVLLSLDELGFPDEVEPIKTESGDELPPTLEADCSAAFTLFSSP